jgi:hypothetical protein
MSLHRAEEITISPYKVVHFRQKSMLSVSLYHIYGLRVIRQSENRKITLPLPTTADLSAAWSFYIFQAAAA